MRCPALHCLTAVTAAVLFTAVTGCSNQPVSPLPVTTPVTATSTPTSTPTTTPTASTATGPVPIATAAAAPPPQLPQGPIPNAAMLQVGDVARGEMGVFDVHGFEGGNDDWRMPMKALDCDRDKEPLVETFLHEHSRTLVHEEYPDGMVVERVVRFATAAQARRHLDDVQTMVRACMRSGDGVFLSIVVRDFAGPGSMVVRWTDGESKTLHTWVRRGNLVAQVWKKKMPTDQEAVQLGERAAARLCAGTVC